MLLYTETEKSMRPMLGIYNHCGSPQTAEAFSHHVDQLRVAVDVLGDAGMQVAQPLLTAVEAAGQHGAQVGRQKARLEGDLLRADVLGQLLYSLVAGRLEPSYPLPWMLWML